MKTKTKILLGALALGASTWMLLAQSAGTPPPPSEPPPPGDGPPGSGHRGHRPPPPPPVIVVLDANHDGVIDAREIANASQALLQLDQNGDGQLTREELRPPPPPEEFDGPPPGEGRPPFGPPDGR